MSALELDPKTTAVVWIDLQNGIVGMPLAPHAAADVVKRAAGLSAIARTAGATVIYVRVAINEIRQANVARRLRPVDAPPVPAIASELVADCGYQDGDLFVTKRQWGAFYGTDLDLHLRRRGIKTIILGGIATNFGVESTGRAAIDAGYDLIFVEDAMSTVTPEMHTFAITTIFPMIGHVHSAEEVAAGFTR